MTAPGQRPDEHPGPPPDRTAERVHSATDPGVLFSGEYELELETWLRRRFRNLCIVYLALGALLVAFVALRLWDEGAMAFTIGVGGRVVTLAVVVYYLLDRRWRGARRDQMIRAATEMIFIIGAISLVTVFVVRFLAPHEAPSLTLPMFVWHFSACLFLPWTPRDSMRPFIPLYALWAVLMLVLPDAGDVVERVLEVIFGPAVFLPGLGITAWRLKRHGRMFRMRMVGKHFVTMRQEFTRARSIHEGMFPAEYDDGFVRFEYRYTPMRELGGDFVHLHVAASGIVHVVLLDVTGHGLAAALTVNRLYGELERIRAEAPRARPGEVLTLLNRYVSLTMARHNIYATAACVMLDPYAGEVAWASAGHPPTFLRSPRGGVSELTATNVLLGAIEPSDYDVDEQHRSIEVGDTIVLFTDGTFEARDRQGRFFGLERMRNLMSLRNAPRCWPSFIEAAIAKHGTGVPDDDMLVAALTLRASRAEDAPEPSREATAATP
jgi:hypothetical protein